MKLDNIRIGKKLLSMVILALFLLIGMNAYSVITQSQSSMQERKAKLKAQVNTTVSLAKHFYAQQNQLGLTTAKQQAINAIQALRYDGNNYFWITNPQQNIIMHPTKPELNGKDASSFKDASGKFHWREMSRISQTTGQGFLKYTWNNPQNENLDKISYVVYIPEWDWIIGSGLLVDDINQKLYSDATKNVLALILCAVILLLLSKKITDSITYPLQEMITQMHYVADGDMTIRFHRHRKDEIGEMSSELDRMLDKTQEALQLAHESADKSAQMAMSIASTSEESAVSIQSQHVQLEQLATAMDQMTATIADVAHNAEQTASATVTITSQAEKSGEGMASTFSKTEQISSQIGSANKLVEELKEGVIEISTVVGVIRGISEQTNLLALNAAIEAARAGEQGRGFAVVADEVRHLATRTQESTNEIQQTIDTLTQSAISAAKAMQQSNISVNDNVETVVSTKDSLNEMVLGLKDANDRVIQIASAAEQQGAVSDEVNHNVSSVNLSIREISSAASHLAEQSQTLAEVSTTLNHHLSYFKV